jgi:hypothetical protein
LPAALVFLITMIAAPVSGAVTFHTEHVARLLLLAVPLSLLGCIPAFAEEIGWRGFLWPLMRRRLTFLASTAIMFVVWWIYHAVLIFAGWYGFMGGIPAFTVGLFGLCCSSACSPSGRGRSGRASWSTGLGMGLSRLTSPHPVQWRTGFSPGAGICSVSLAGWRQWECSFLASGSCGGISVPQTKDGLSPKEPTGYESPLMWLWFRNTPKLKTPATPATAK